MFKLTKGNPVFVEPAKIEPELGIKEGEDIYTMTEDFLIRHRQLSESTNKVVFIHSPRCQGKSWTEMLLRRHIDDLHYKRTKLLQSKSKQSRIVSVVCK